MTRCARARSSGRLMRSTPRAIRSARMRNSSRTVHQTMAGSPRQAADAEAIRTLRHRARKTGVGAADAAAGNLQPEEARLEPESCLMQDEPGAEGFRRRNSSNCGPGCACGRVELCDEPGSAVP